MRSLPLNTITCFTRSRFNGSCRCGGSLNFNPNRKGKKMLENYIGVKRIEAEPMQLGAYNIYKGWKIPDDEDPEKEGYLVKYSDTYESWSPKDVFEDAYLPIGVDGTKITQETVDAFMGEVTAEQFDEKTTIVVAKTITGFKQYEVSSCVDPKNYDQEIGKDIGKKRIESTIWKCLGFVLQWANYGLKK